MYFIGISAYYHDSSVALIDINGTLVDFKKEEWLSRVKGDKSFPRLSLKEMVISHNLSEKNISSIIFYEKPVRSWLTILKHSIKNNSVTNDLTRNYFKNAWKSSMRFQMDISKHLNTNKIEILYLDHHLSHTLCSLYYTNELPCVSVVVDGYGDKSCTSIHHIKSFSQIDNLWNSDYPDSLGLFYSAITEFLGFAVNEGEYKMMGLAAFGKPQYYEKIKETIKFEHQKLMVDTDYYDYVRRIDRSYSEKLIELLNVKPRIPNNNLELGTNEFQIYANIAASAQKVLEEILFEILKLAFNLTGEKKILLSGGVAMNSVAISKCANLNFIESINVPPSPGDSGAAIGASYFGYLKKNNHISKNKTKKITDQLFPGNSISDETFFELVFDKIADKETSIEETAKLIENNQIIATCYKNIETGPRALGHRSLICNAHNKDLIKKLSTDIKKRNLFRPTAPVILEKNAEKYFKVNEKIKNCYYHMGSIAEPLKDVIEDIRGVVHYDNTSRVQICNEEQLLGRILSKLEDKNIFLIANTSFNISSDPMVYSKEDAYLAVERMNIRYLLTENGLYLKKEKKN